MFSRNAELVIVIVSLPRVVVAVTTTTRTSLRQQLEPQLPVLSHDVDSAVEPDS